jgi:hypothetical protein
LVVEIPGKVYYFMRFKIKLYAGKKPKLFLGSVIEGSMRSPLPIRDHQTEGRKGHFVSVR